MPQPVSSPASPLESPAELPEGGQDSYLPVLHADGSAHYPDGTIDRPDGTIESNGWVLEVEDIDWDELDPPEGSPEAEEIPHEVVIAEIRKKFGW